MIEVIKPGLETSVQDLPGRLGYWEQGFPPSGPFDAWSFRLANLLVGNDRDAAALECQLVGPALRFASARAVAIAGAPMDPRLDGEPVPMWTTLLVQVGQVLELGAAREGMRAYIAIAGGIDTPPVLGSRSTFHMAGVGGIDGYALKSGQHIPVGPQAPVAIMTVAAEARPPIGSGRTWEVECMLGPNDDWLDAASTAQFFESDWTLQARSNRTGMRLTGPSFAFSEKALNKRPEHGQDPSNILDHGYPLGAINLAGQTPIILVNDAPSTGGFINPFTVPSAAFWKLAQARPGDALRFKQVTMQDAHALRRRLDALCTGSALQRV